MITCLSQHLTQQMSPSCACIDVLHNWALYLLSVHIDHKACVSSQTKRWLVSWDPHHISSTDDVLSAYSLMLALVLCTSERCTRTWAHMLRFQCTSVTPSVSSDSAVIDDLICAAYSSSTDDVFWPYCLSQQPPWATSVSTSSTHLCLHRCSAQLTAVLELGTYGVDCEQQSQGLCVIV